MMNDQKIKHASTPQVVSMRVELSSADMVHREFAMNGIEASADIGKPKVVFAFREIDGVRKQCVWNNGPGMTANQLCENMNLAVSGEEKNQHLKGNFGVGAKVTGLKANRLGLIYRSCADGVVSEVHLGRDADGDYALLDWGDGVGVVADISDAFTEKERKHDWTEVTQLGNYPKHDTFSDPYGNGETPEGGKAYWLVQKLTQRFYDIRHNGVQVHCVSTEDFNRHVKGLSHQPVQQEETVLDESGVKIRYAVLPEPVAKVSGKKSGNWASYGYVAHGAIVYANEVYGMMKGQSWTSNASMYGVPSGSNRVVIQVLLPEDFDGSPNLYRTEVERSDLYGNRKPVRLDDFADQIYDQRPDWFIDFIVQNTLHEEDQSDYQKKRLKALVKSLRIRQHKADEQGDECADDSETGVERSGERSGVRREKNPGENRTSGMRSGTRRRAKTIEQRNQDILPEIVWQGLGSKDTRGELSQRLARYDKYDHRIILNKQYEPVEELCDLVMSKLKIDVAMREKVLNMTKEEFAYAAIAHVMFALFQEGETHWSLADVSETLTPEAITISAGLKERLVTSLSYRLRSKGKRNG